jgi:release factor glutamine methyltransferase
MNDNIISYLEVINLSTEYLSKKGVPNPKCDVEWIVSSVTNKKRVELYLNFENPVERNQKDKIRKLIIDRGKRKPLQHILGKVNFAGYEIKCDKRALIPRPETEYLTELIMDRLDKGFCGKILDMGTGSGAILITLCIQNKECTGIGIDKSSDAIKLAEENSQFHSLDNIKFKNFDWNERKLAGMFDVIVSNPPYLSENEWKTCEPEVRQFDPKEALVSGGEGLNDLIKIIKESSQLLNKGGLIALEMGVGQKEILEQEMENLFFGIEVVKDFSGRERFILAKKS